jgi:adenine deaminase
MTAGLGGASRLWEVGRRLVSVALGREKATLVLRGGNLVNVNSGELLEGWDVAAWGDRIAYVGPSAEHAVGPDTQVIDARGRYVVPGFLDAHVHIESSMVGVTEFARMVLPFGTTCAFIDNHEIGNVLGLRGIRLMMDEARNVPLRVFLTVPSCIPSSSGGLETAGAELGPQEIAEALRWEETIALGEMMNFPGILGLDEKMHEEVAEAHRAGKPVEGHDSFLLDRELAAYAAAGITSSHESVRKVDAVQRLRLGMYVYCREGSAWLDVKETVKAITEEGLDPRHACLVTDDKEPHSIVKDGHMNHCVRRAIEEGVDPITAVQMATLNPAEHYGLSLHLGSIAPARLADIVLLEDLTRAKVDQVFVGGRLVAKGGRLVEEVPRPYYPAWARGTVRLASPLRPEDFRIPPPRDAKSVRVRVIGAIEGKVYTRALEEELEVVDGDVRADPERQIYKIAVVERHGKGGGMGRGFVKGFGWRGGAIATTVAHDSHNLLVVGSDERDMSIAANKLAETGGGICTVLKGEVLSLVELPIAGLMSDEPFERVASKVRRMYEVWERLGCTWVSPFMTLSLMALVVLPELRISDRGLVDVTRSRLVPLFVDAAQG